MTKQTKQITLTQYKALDGDAGGFSAYATIFGELDDSGDIILAGAYKNTIPQFLKRGFIARGHDWTTTIGMPTAAHEDTVGLVVEARYHNTAPAQEERMIRNERAAAGLSSFVSIGYEAASSPIYVMPADYATEIPKYSAPSMVEQNLAKASSFPEVRVLPEIHLYEISLVQVPALSSAVVTGAKSEGPLAGQTLEQHSHSVLAAVKEYADREADLSALRTKEGRPISEARRSRIAKVVDALASLDEIRDELRALLDETAPKQSNQRLLGDDTEKSVPARQELIRFLTLEAQALGVQI